MSKKARNPAAPASPAAAPREVHAIGSTCMPIQFGGDDRGDFNAHVVALGELADRLTYALRYAYRGGGDHDHDITLGSLVDALALIADLRGAAATELARSAT